MYRNMLATGTQGSENPLHGFSGTFTKFSGLLRSSGVHGQALNQFLFV